MKLADKFTMSRLLLAPIIFLILFVPVWTGKFELLSVILVVPLYAYAEFTDFLDGFSARKKNEVSDFGKLFDPFADVMLHLTIFVYCLVRGYMNPVIFLLIFYREFSMIFLRMMAVKKGVSVGARKGGKIKTVLYIVTGIVCLLLELIPRTGLIASTDIPEVFSLITTGLFVVCLIACYISFIDYLVQFKKIFAE